MPEATVDASHCGVHNETLSQLALHASMEHDEGLARKLCSYSTVINDPTTPGSNEWLYGGAGYLYLLRLAKSAFLVEEKYEPLRNLMDKTAALTIERIYTSSTPWWEWHGNLYLGAVHGAVGIMVQTLLSSKHPERIAERIIQPVLEKYVLGMQMGSGNFPSSAGSVSDRLVQFCHGAPGVVICLRQMERFFGDEMQKRIKDAVGRAQDVVWERGLLVKSPCLCHGVPANALALADEEKFGEFLRYISSEELDRRKDVWGQDGDKAVGLWTGEGGRAWVWAVCDLVAKERKTRIEMGVIGFDDV